MRAQEKGFFLGNTSGIGPIPSLHTPAPRVRTGRSASGDRHNRILARRAYGLCPVGALMRPGA